MPESKSASAVENDCYFLDDAVEDGNFEHALVPAELEETLNPEVSVCILFTTGWGRGRIQERNKILSKQKQEKIIWSVRYW